MTLLPAALVFLILLLNDKPLMGEYVNTRWQNFANWSIVIFVIVVSTVFAVSVLFFASGGYGAGYGGGATHDTLTEKGLESDPHGSEGFSVPLFFEVAEPADLRGQDQKPHRTADRSGFPSQRAVSRGRGIYLITAGASRPSSFPGIAW